MTSPSTTRAEWGKQISFSAPRFAGDPASIDLFLVFRRGIPFSAELFPLFWLEALTEANARTTPVLINEFDSSGFKGAAHCQIVCSRHRCLTFRQLSPTDGGDT
jgi:hypothetical protein